MTRTPRNTALRAFAPAWLRGDSEARALLPGGFDQRDVRVAAARRAAARRCDPILLDALTAQHSSLAPSAARQRNLDALAAGDTAVVVSGQQVGLFTGPAFTLYKAAGVVAAAHRLSQESGIRCVPLFWLQTEDHDWPEIDHCFVHGKNGESQRVAVSGGDVPARVPVASRAFDAGIGAALDGLAEALGAHPHAGEVVALMRSHYHSGASPASAFRGVLAELFADDGLLFLDPRAPEIAALARPLLERSLTDADSLCALLQRRSDAIEGVGLAVQVPVRRGAPLCFFHPDGTGGPRYRLEPRAERSGGPTDEGWRICDTDREVSRDEALRVLGEDPLRFSSSALLRPLLQDSLLPTAMYLGGPGEIAYFAQLAPLYEALDIEMPLVAPRPSLCITSAGDRRRLEALGIAFADVGGDRDALLTRLTRPQHQGAAEQGDAQASLQADIARAFDEFAAKAVSMDPNLARPVDKARASIEHSVSRLAEKYSQSVLQRDSVLVERVDRVRAALAPGGVPQERVYGFASLAAEHSIADLLTAIRRTIEPFDGRCREIAL